MPLHDHLRPDEYINLALLHPPHALRELSWVACRVRGQNFHARIWKRRLRLFCHALNPGTDGLLGYLPCCI